MLVVPAHPLLLSAFVLADSALPHGSASRISGGYVVPEASHRAVTSPACPGRERLMEQPVSSGHTRSCETETHATCRSHKHVLRNIDTHRRNIHLWILRLPGNACIFHLGTLMPLAREDPPYPTAPPFAGG